MSEKPPSSDDERNEALDWLVGRGAPLVAISLIVIALAVLWKIVSGLF